MMRMPPVAPTKYGTWVRGVAFGIILGTVPGLFLGTYLGKTAASMRGEVTTVQESLNAQTVCQFAREAAQWCKP